MAITTSSPQSSRQAIAPTAEPVAKAASTPTGLLYTLQMTAFILMVAGWGWDNGQFVQPVNTSYGPIADALHFLPVALLLLFGLRYFRPLVAYSRGASIGVTVIAIISIIGCAVMLVLGLTNPDPNSVGVHTFEDLMPVLCMNAGTFLWLGSLFMRRSA